MKTKKLNRKLNNLKFDLEMFQSELNELLEDKKSRRKHRKTFEKAMVWVVTILAVSIQTFAVIHFLLNH